MNFWVLEQRDTYTRERDGACFYQVKEPSNFAECFLECPDCGRVVGPSKWLPPYNLDLSRSECGDLVLGAAFELLVSEKLKEVYNRSSLCGLDEFHRVDNLTLPGSARHAPAYYVTRPRITFTVLDEKASGLEWKKPPRCNTCRLGVRAKIERVVVDKDTWDGSDIFMATGFYGSILVTERFVEIANRANLTNVVVIASDQYSEGGP